jgi:hypothetical protein
MGTNAGVFAALVLITVILLLSGCAGNVAASGPLPFPTIPIGGATITLEPGDVYMPNFHSDINSYRRVWFRDFQ